MNPSGPLSTQSPRPAGEPFVWLTAMGLTVGLVMILFLLGLVLFKGLKAFWPRPVAEITLKEESADALQGVFTFAGEIVKHQKKIADRVISDSQDQANQLDREMEWQLFVANKDVYGLSFKYVNRADIIDIAHPTHLFRLERMEYGPAIGYPVRLQLDSDKSVPASSPQFLSELDRLVEEANQRRERIKELEKDRIGSINQRLNDLRLREQYLNDQPELTSGQQSELKQIQTETTELEAQYQELAAQARQLRERQEQDQLTYRLASGQEQTIPIGQVIHYYFPNQLDLGDRLGLLARNLWVFVSTDPREANTDGGIFPAIFGTVVMTVLMSLLVTPFGVLAAIYLREYASQGATVRSVRIAVNNLAGVPSIVFGVFGLGFFVYLVGGTIDSIFYPEALPSPTFGTGGILWASLTLALLTVPVVIVSTEEALASVPRGHREGSMACGASKWQTIQRIVLPASAPGILTGVILAMARGAGEVAPLMLVGVVKLAPELAINTTYPYIHLEQKFMHLGFHIYDLGFQSPDSEAAKPMVFATTLLLIGLVISLNLLAIVIRERLRRKYATGAF